MRAMVKLEELLELLNFICCAEIWLNDMAKKRVISEMIFNP